MPLPFIVGVGAAALGIQRAVEIKDAKDKIQSAEKYHEENILKFDLMSKSIYKEMDALDKLKLEIQSNLEEYSNTIEKVHNYPKAREYKNGDGTLIKYDRESLKNFLEKKELPIGSMGGYAVGPAYAVPAAIIPVIPAVVGGVVGYALGTLGPQLSTKAEETWEQVKREEERINSVCDYLEELKKEVMRYSIALNTVKDKFQENFLFISYIVNKLQKIDGHNFSKQERIAAQNTDLLATLLYNMCQINLINKAENENEMNTVNKRGINKVIQDSDQILKEIN